MSAYSPGPLVATDVELGNGRLAVDDQEHSITDASFSPDGTAIAISNLDGEVSRNQKSASVVRSLGRFKTCTLKANDRTLLRLL